VALVVAAALGRYVLSHRGEGSSWKNATFTQATNQPVPDQPRIMEIGRPWDEGSLGPCLRWHRQANGSSPSHGPKTGVVWLGTVHQMLGLLDTRSGKSHEILSVAPNGIFGVAASADDRHIYFGLNSVGADVWLRNRE
jgi:hypothetical protein